MKIKVLLSLLALLAFTAKSQTPQFRWAEQINGEALGDIFVSSMTTDPAGNLYTTGIFDGTIDFDPGPGIDTVTQAGFGDLYITKMDSSGNLLWVKTIGGPSYDAGTSIKTDAAGNVYIAGFFSTDSVDFDPGPGVFLMSTGESSFVLKLDENGNFVWAKYIAGLNENQATALALDQQNNILVMGQFSGTADFDPGPGSDSLTSFSTDIYIWKLDNNGNYIWAKQIGALSGSVAHSIGADASGNVLVSGILLGTSDFDPGPSVFNLTNSLSTSATFFLKLNNAGDFTWANKIENADIGLSGGSILIDASGNLYLAGNFTSTADFDPGPGTQNLTAAPGNNYFLLKLDSNAAFSWVKQLPNVEGTCLDFTGNIYTCGSSIRKFNHAGVSQWVSDSSLSKIITTDQAGNIYTFGTFSGTVDFDPGPGIFNLTASSALGTYFQKLGQSLPSGIVNIAGNEGSFNVYPNPVHDLFYLQSDIPADFTIINSLGQSIKSLSVSTMQPACLNIADLPAGVYLISDHKRGVHKKIIVKR